MLSQPTCEKSIQMHMNAMVDAYRQQAEDPSAAELSFEERRGFLVCAKYWSRHNRLKQDIHKIILAAYAFSEDQSETEALYEVFTVQPFPGAVI